MRDRPTLDLFLISWVLLFLELTCIRWFPSHVMFLTFFTNIVLLACFVGMSVGCLAARNPTRYLDRTPLWLAVAVAAGLLVEQFRFTLLKYIAIGDRSNVDVVFFGAEAGDTAPDLPFRIPLEVVAGAFFLLIAVLLVGPGQEMGRAFTRVPSRTRAYAVNLLGSLAGIGSFAACSYLQLPPVVWFGAVGAGLAYFAYQPVRAAAVTPVPGAAAAAPAPRPGFGLVVAFLAFAAVLSLFTSGFVHLRGRDTFWSPYYRIDYLPDVRLIDTNLVSHQIMEPRNRVPAAHHANYALPYLFQRDVTGPDGKPAWQPIKRVLIIGAGSGNDVSRALQWLPADAQIDAVEIDPVIQRLGIEHHPDRPYQDPRVNRVLNDGRNFLHRAAPETYDLVVFALVDSLVLHSGYSNLRLESYLFTVEAFQDARRVLKPTGVCAVYNYFRHGWLAARIRAELKTAFAVDPAVFVLTQEPTDAVELDAVDPAAFTVFLAGSDRVIDPLRAKFAAHGNWYWVPGDRAPSPDPEQTPGHFGPEKPGPLPPATVPLPPKVEPRDWVPLRIATVDDLGHLRVATDDWPFLYVREPGIPLVTWRGMAMMVILSAVLWLIFRPRETSVDSATRSDYSLAARSFFLGAGFMLVETKAVVHMALLFGSTWMVNSVVFAAILMMSLAGTLFVAGVRPKRLEPYYAGLFATIGLGLAVSLKSFLGLDPTLQVLGACALVFAPIAFAGVVFATSFARSVRPDRVFGANVAGALVGGLAENASVILGFQYLLCVAGGFYLLSALFGNHTPPATDAEPGV
jgi:SAM-dependent methyltransferase